MSEDDLAVRVARSEMERDAALEREQKAKDSERRAWEACAAVVSGDKAAMLRTLTIIGIPAQDFADIYEIERTWQREGGTQGLLDWWREQRVAG